MARSVAITTMSELFETDDQTRDGGAHRWIRRARGSVDQIWAVEAAPESRLLTVELNRNVRDLNEHAALAEAVYEGVGLLGSVYDMVVVYGRQVEPFDEDEMKSASAIMSAHKSSGLRRLVRVMDDRLERSLSGVIANTESLGVPSWTVRSVAEARGLLARTAFDRRI